MASRPIVVSIQGDDSDLRRALKNASDGVKGFGKTVGKIGAKAGAAFAGTAAAVGVAGVTAFASFESQVREVLTLLPDAGAGAFDEISSQVTDFAKEFGVLPAEVVPALYQALSAGVPRDNVFEFLETAQKAAKGGVTDLSTSVDGISSVLNSYSDQISGATEVSDLMATSVRLGKTTFDEMSNSLFQVAPIAASLKVPFEAITSSISVLTAQGVPTSVAAVQMKGALAELGKEGTKADVAFRDLAGVGFTQFLEQGGSFGEAITLMKDGSDDLGISVLDMFGSIEAGQAILALTSDGGEAYTEVLGEMQGSAGATQAAFDTMDTGLAAGFDRIRANLSVLAIEIGERIAPYIETATEVVLKAFDNLGPAIVQAKEFIIELRDEIADRTVPVLRRIRDVMETVADKVMAAFRVVDEYLRPGIVRAKEAIVALIDQGVNRLISLFNSINWGEVGATLAEAFITARDAVLDFVRGIPDAFREVIDWIKRNKEWLLVLGGVIGGLVVGWYAYQAGVIAVTAAKTALLAVTTAWAAVMAILASPVLLVVAAIAALTGGLIAAYFQFNEVRTVVDAVARFLVDNVLPIFKAFWDSLVIQVLNVWTIISNFVELVSAIFSGDWADAWEDMKDLAGGVLDLVVEAVIGLPGRLLGALAPLGGQLLEWAGTAMGALLDVMTDKANDITDLFKNLPSLLYTALVDAAVWLLLAGRNIGKKLLKGIGEGLGAAVDWVSSIAVDITNALIGFINDVIGDLNSMLEFTIPVPFVSDININPPDIPSIALLARGGIATGAGSGTLARIGEAGEPEAVVPLSRASEFGFGGGGITLNIHAGMGTDGVEVGNQIVSILKQWERHNGSLPLSTSTV